jgi:hypothetical protein
MTLGRCPGRLLATAVVGACLAASTRSGVAGEVPGSGGWSTGAPRDEIRPEFACEPGDGPGRPAVLAIKAGLRDGVDGYWTKAFPVTGGRYYHFDARYRAEGVELPRRSVVAEIHWRDASGQHVPLDEPAASGYLKGVTPMAETEFPATRGDDGSGWTEVSDTYRAPSRATQAIVELHLRWARGGEVRWRGVSLAETSPPSPLAVRLAAVHFRPSGGTTPEDNRRMYEPLIAEAARRKADLVVLGETLTYPGLGKKYHEVAESIPGPSTEYFGRLSKERGLYIVAGLLERDGGLVYNVAVLLGPDGRLVGMYRKTCLPRGKVEGASRRGPTTRSSRPGSARSG